MEYVLLLLMAVPPVILVVLRNHRGGGCIDLGVVFTGIVFVYAWFPLLGMILAHLGCGILQDQRVVDEMPTMDEVVAVGMSYFAFLVGFTFIYGWRRNRIRSSITAVRSDGLQVWIAVVVAVSLVVFNFSGSSLLGVGTGESYIESYTQVRKLPLPLQQVMNGLLQLSFTASVAAVVFILSWRPRLHRYVILIVVVALLGATFSGGSRTFGFLLAFAYLVCLSIYVRNFQTRHLLMVAVGGLALFIFAGVLRADNGFDLLLLAPLQDGEFVSLFINSVDLMRQSMQDSAISFPWQIYWVDILRFVPQQFLSFEKVDPAVWYVKEFFPTYYDMGGGLAFGAIAESVAGFGIVDALARGGLLGFAYSFVANRCMAGQLSPMKAFIYVWFVVMSYQAIRDTTFSVFPRFFLQVLPVIVLLFLGNHMMRTILRGTSARDSTGAKDKAP